MQAALQLANESQRAYFLLRRGMGLLALAYPPALWALGRLLFDEPLQTSISAYYHTPLRDVMVGALFAIGVFLWLYRGGDDRLGPLPVSENQALNVAGACALGVALFPMDKAGDCVASAPALSVHGTFAAVFFVAIASVCLFARDGKAVILAERQVRRLRPWKRACGVAMLLSIGTAVGYHALQAGPLHDRLCEAGLVFWVEFVGVWAFGIYWILCSLEQDAASRWLPRWHRQRSDEPLSAAA